MFWEKNVFWFSSHLIGWIHPMAMLSESSKQLTFYSLSYSSLSLLGSSLWLPEESVWLKHNSLALFEDPTSGASEHKKNVDQKESTRTVLLNCISEKNSTKKIVSVLMRFSLLKYSCMRRKHLYFHQPILLLDNI